MQKSTTAAVTIQVRASILRSRRRPTTIAATPPTAAIQVASAGPPSSSPGPKSPGNASCSAMPAPSAAGSTSGPTIAVSTAVPPASANEIGTNPARRRACETETASAKCGNTHGSSSMPSTASVPPSTKAAQRCRAANAASGNEHEPCHGDRAAARDHLRTKRVVMERADVQLLPVFRQRALELALRRRVRRRLPDERQEPGERGTGRQEERRERRGRAARIAAGEQHAGDGEAEQRARRERRRCSCGRAAPRRRSPQVRGRAPTRDAAGRGRRA